MKHSGKLIPCLLSAMILAGCQTPRTSGVEVDVREGAPAYLRWDDSGFAQHVELAETPIMARTEFGFLRSDVWIRNRKARDFAFQYKFCWFDANGLEVMPGKGIWEQKTIHGHETASLVGVAPDPSAVRFAVRLRRVR